MMRLKYFALSPIAFFLLTGCVNAMPQQTYTQPPTVTQMQAHCFYAFKKFSEQTKCIEDGVASYGVASSNYVQEYLAYMQLLQQRVGHKTLSESDARVKLTNKLSQVRASEQNELATQQQLLVAQEQLDNQRTMQAYEMLNKNKSPALEFHPMQPVLTTPKQTDCRMFGQQLHCITR